MFRAHHTAGAGETPDEPQPLAASRSDLGTLRAQALVSAGVLIACAGRLPVHGRWAPALTLAAAFVAAVCAARLFAASQAHARLVLDLVADGGSAPGARDVARLREQLTDTTHRSRLADTLDSVATAPERGTVLVNVRVAGEAAEDLRATARALRAAGPGVRGVAIVERLLGDGCSVLYGPSTDALRCELRRAQYHLATTGEARTSTSR